MFWGDPEARTLFTRLSVPVLQSTVANLLGLTEFQVCNIYMHRFCLRG